MNLKTIKNVVTSKVGRQILLGRKNSPTILFAGGLVGVVGSTVLACKATLKLEDVLDKAERDHNTADSIKNNPAYTGEDRKSDHLKLKIRTAGEIVRLYAPAVGVGVVSVAALTGSHVTLSRRNAAVMAAYSALDKGFNEYRSRVREEFGDDKDQELRHGSEVRTVIEDTEKGTKTSQVTTVGGGQPSIYAKFFDDGSTSWSRDPEYNRVFLHAQQSYANNLLHARGHLFLNEVYDNLGLPRSPAGAVVGWIVSKEGDNFVDFGIFNDDGGVRGERIRAFVNGYEGSILLDFNVDGVIWDKI